MWKIIDDDGEVYSGNEDYIREVWEDITENGNPDDVEWNGNLMLIEVHDIAR